MLRKRGRPPKLDARVRRETLTGIKTNRAHFHDIRAKSISDNENLNDAYLLAGHIDIAMTRKTYDRNRRRVQPLR